MVYFVLKHSKAWKVDYKSSAFIFKGFHHLNYRTPYLFWYALCAYVYCTYVCVCVCVCVCVYLCMYVYIYIYISVCVCLCV